MKESNAALTLDIETTDQHCPIGEKTGRQMMAQGNIPVISCEGSCIRGEIARRAANLTAKQDGYGRGCHGEILSVPASAMAEWARQSEKIVVIDGCFLHCHGRMMTGIFKPEQLAVFDALSFYGKYTDIMDPDDVPEPEIRETAKLVSDRVLGLMDRNETAPGSGNTASGCGQPEAVPSGCCGN